MAREPSDAASPRWESHWKLFRLAEASSTAAEEAVGEACAEIVDIMAELVAVFAYRRRHANTFVTTASVSADTSSQAALFELLLSKLRALCCLQSVCRQGATQVPVATLCNMLSYLSDKKLNSSPVSSHSLELLGFACRSLNADQSSMQPEIMPVLSVLLSNNGADRMRILLGMSYVYSSRSTEVKQADNITFTAPDITLFRCMQFLAEQMPDVRYRTISGIVGALMRAYGQFLNYCDQVNQMPSNTAAQCVLELFLIFYIQHASIFTSGKADFGANRRGSNSTCQQPKRLKLFGSVLLDVENFSILCAFPADTDAVSKGYDAHRISQVCNVSIFSRFKIFIKSLAHAGQRSSRLIDTLSAVSAHENVLTNFFKLPVEDESLLSNEWRLAKQLYASFKSRVTNSQSLMCVIISYCDSVLTLCRAMANSFLPQCKRSGAFNQSDADKDALCSAATHAVDCLRLILTSDRFADDIFAQASKALDTFIDRLCFTQEGVEVLRHVLHASLPTMLNAVVSVAGQNSSQQTTRQATKSCADHAYIYRRIQTIVESYLAVPDYLVVSLRRWALFDAFCKCSTPKNLTISYQPHWAVLIDHLPALFFALVCNAKLYSCSMLRLIPALVTAFPTTAVEILFDLILNMPLLAQAVDVYLLISDEGLRAANAGSEGAFATPAMLAFRDPASSDTYAFMKNITPALRRFAYAVVALKTTEDFNSAWPSWLEVSQNENDMLKLEFRSRVADAIEVMPALLSKLLETVTMRRNENQDVRVSASPSKQEPVSSTASDDKVMALVLTKILDHAQLNFLLLRTPHVRSTIDKLLSDAVGNIVTKNAHWLTAIQSRTNSLKVSAEEEENMKCEVTGNYADVIIEHLGCQFLLRSPPVFTALVRSVGVNLVQQLSTVSISSCRKGSLAERALQQSTCSETAHRRFYEALESATYEIVRQNGELKYKQHLLNDEAILEAVVALLEALAAVGYCGGRRNVVADSGNTLNVRPAALVSGAATDDEKNTIDNNYARRTVICFNNLMQRMQAMPADDNYRAAVVGTIESLVEEYNMPSLNDVVLKLASSNERQVEPEVMEALQRQMTPSHSGEFSPARKRVSGIV